VSLTCITNVAANPFEKLDHFRDTLPLRIVIANVEYTRENLEEDQGNR
jgi:hypothetical protein